MATAKTSPFRVRGQVVALATRLPVGGLPVSICLAPIEGDAQPVGDALTDEGGTFDISFAALKDPFEIAVVVVVRDRQGRDVPEGELALTVRRAQDVWVEFAVPGLEFGDEWPNLRYIQGEPVNVRHAAELTREDLIATYVFARGRGAAPARIELVKAAFPTLFSPRHPDDDCGEGHMSALRFYMAEKSALTSERITAADDLPAGAAVQWFYTDNVKVKYTTDNAFPDDAVPAALPAADAEVLLSDGTIIGHTRQLLADLHPDNTAVAPTVVQEVGVIAEHALDTFLSPAYAFRDPRDGASRLEIRILNCQSGGGRANGLTHAGWAHAAINNHNSYLTNLHTVPHELFHRVQYQYNNTMVKSGMYGAIREGGARLIEDAINDQTNFWVTNARSMLDQPYTSLNTVSYASVLFWKYIAEQHSTHTSASHEPAIGIDTCLRVLEASATRLPSDPGTGYAPLILRSARAAMVSPGFGRFDQFRYFDAASTELDTHETTWGNFLVANFLHGTANPVSDGRFDYLEDEDPVTPGTDKLANHSARIYSHDSITLAAGNGPSRTHSLSEWAARYYRVRADSITPARLVRVQFNSDPAVTDPLVQILRIGPGGALVDLHRCDRPSWSKTIDLAGLDSIVVIVASRSTGGSHTIQFDAVVNAADTMITRWNSSGGTEYEVNPVGWAWTWTSPDIMVDNDNDGLADTHVFFGQNNRLKVRLRNRGNLDAAGLKIEFWYQKATPLLSTAAWIPVENLAGTLQQVTGATLPAAAISWFAVDWAPVDDGTGHEHWCVKVKVTAPGEPNTDNKMAFTNFAHVVAGSRSMPLLLRLPAAFAVSRLHAVPRGPRWTIPLSPTQSEILSGHSHAKCAGADLPGPAASSRPVRIRVLDRGTNDRPADHGGAANWKLRDAERQFPADERTLPPGVDRTQLVTLVHVIDRVVVGGITYAVDRCEPLSDQCNAAEQRISLSGDEHGVE